MYFITIYILKLVTIHFNCTGFGCNAVFRWDSGSVLWTGDLHTSSHQQGIFIFGWTIALNCLIKSKFCETDYTLVRQAACCFFFHLYGTPSCPSGCLRQVCYRATQKWTGAEMPLAVLAGRRAGVVSPSVWDSWVSELTSGHPVHHLTQREVLWWWVRHNEGAAISLSSRRH